MKKRIGPIIGVLLVLSLIMPLNSVRAASAVVQVSPSSLTVGLGSTFSVDLTVSGVVNLGVWEFRLFYLSSVLNCIGAVKGSFLESGGNSQFFAFTLYPSYNATYGCILLGASLVGNVPGVSGGGTLATVTFQAVGAGDTVLHLDGDPIWNFLLDSSPPPRNPIPYTAADGVVHATSTTVQVSPWSLTVGLGSTFSVDLTVSGVVNLGVWEFRLFYLSNVVSCTGAVKGSFLESGGNSQFFAFTLYPSYNATYGCILLGASLVGNVPGVSGGGTLATVTFQAVGAGDTVLHLDGDPIWTFLLDSSPPPRNPITYVVVDGTVHVAAVSDLAITGIPFDKGIICSGYSGNISVTIANLGDLTETFNVTLYATLEFNQTIVATLNSTCDSSSFSTLTFIWNTTGFAGGNYTLSAYVWPVLGETNITNNNFIGGNIFVSIVGDITGPIPFVPDGRVDIRDIAAVAKCFGTAPGNPGWIADCDVNNDGRVDIRDIAIVAKHFGGSTPPPTVGWYVTVETDKLYYHNGDKVYVDGACTYSNVPQGSVDVSISVSSSNGTLYYLGTATTDTSGEYSLSFAIGINAALGEYVVTASANGNYTQTSFQLVSNIYNTIYIRANGDVEPASAPILKNGKVYTLTYNFTANSINGIVIERNNTIFDGSGLTVLGTMISNSNGINLTSVSNVTVINIAIQSFYNGIYASGCSQCHIANTTISSNAYGVYLYESNFNELSGNNITRNGYAGIWLETSQYNNISMNDQANSITFNGIGGIRLRDSSNSNNIIENYLASNAHGGIFIESSYSNYIYHNNFVNNSAVSDSSGNFWDDGYPAGGNYWGDLAGTDSHNGPYQNQTGSDGIYDTPYFIYTGNLDNYPLVNPYPSHDISIIQASLSPGVVSQGNPFYVNVLVINKGDSNEASSIALYANSTIFIGSLAVPMLIRSAQTIIITVFLAQGNYTITAYLEPVPGETNIADNTCIAGTVQIN